MAEAEAAEVVALLLQEMVAMVHKALLSSAITQGH
jgi:hypothetical protein